MEHNSEPKTDPHCHYYPQILGFVSEHSYNGGRRPRRVSSAPEYHVCHRRIWPATEGLAASRKRDPRPRAPGPRPSAMSCPHPCLPLVVLRRVWMPLAPLTGFFSETGRVWCLLALLIPDKARLRVWV